MDRPHKPPWSTGQLFNHLSNAVSTYMNIPRGRRPPKTWGKVKKHGIKQQTEIDKCIASWRFIAAVQTRWNILVTFHTFALFDHSVHSLAQCENNGSFASVIANSSLCFTTDGLNECPFCFVWTYKFDLVSVSMCLYFVVPWFPRLSHPQKMQIPFSIRSIWWSSKADIRGSRRGHCKKATNECLVHCTLLRYSSEYWFFVPHQTVLLQKWHFDSNHFQRAR